MLRLVDQVAGVLVGLIGLAHLAVGHIGFVQPTEGRVWFLSAGFLLVTTGITNLARARSRVRDKLVAAAALSGAAAILASGALIARSSPELLGQPQTVMLIGVGLLLTVLSTRDLIRRSPA